MTAKTNGLPPATWARLHFAYDWQWRRVEKKVSLWNPTTSTYDVTDTQRFVYDGWNLVAVLDAPSSALLASFAWGLDLTGTEQGAGGVGGLLMATLHGTSTTSHYPAYDGNGNVMAMLNAETATYSARYEFGPFHELIRATGPKAKDFNLLAATKYCDWESGLYYYGYRYLGDGRWLSRDPLEEEGGSSLYRLVDNNPIMLIDLLGLSACDRFVESILTDFDQQGSVNGLGDNWLWKRNTTLSDTSGFKIELISGGQGGAVSRHIYGHGGAVMAFESAAGLSPIGTGASLLNQGFDWVQQFDKNRTTQEADAEIAGDRAARAVADVLRKAYHSGKSNDCAQKENMRSDLKVILCE